MKVRTLGVLCVLAGGCSAADAQTDERVEVVHELEADEPGDTGNAAIGQKAGFGLAAPASARKPTPDPWRIAAPVDKPTPDPWSGEGCSAPPEDSTAECGASHENAAPPAEPATLDP